MNKFVIVFASLLTLAITPAQARHHHIQHKSVSQCVETGNIMQPCAYQPNFLAGVKSINVKMHRERHSETTIISHPAGCPRSAFCGCGTSVEVFGHPVRELFLAANWYKFPRTSPQPGAVMVRQHHVALLKEHIEGSVWLVIDHNSGGHLSRIHARSIAGYTIVSPRA